MFSSEEEMTPNTLPVLLGYALPPLWLWRSVCRAGRGLAQGEYLCINVLCCPIPAAFQPWLLAPLSSVLGAWNLL